MVNGRYVLFRPLQALGHYFKRSFVEYANLPLKVKLKRGGIGCLKLVNLACFIHLFPEYVGRPSTMSGPSMLPTLAAGGEVIIEDRLSVRLDPDKFYRGELLIFKSPLHPARMVCKRVAGLPGDVICVDPTGEKAHSTEHVVVPNGHLWMIGDNASWSRDSRTYGPVPMGLIYSRLRARVWPIKDFKIFGSNLSYID